MNRRAIATSLLAAALIASSCADEIPKESTSEVRAAYASDVNRCLKTKYCWKMNLTGAILRLADLTKADLTGATLRLANLTGANFIGADITYAEFKNATCPDGEPASEGEKTTGFWFWEKTVLVGTCCGHFSFTDSKGEFVEVKDTGVTGCTTARIR